MAIHRQIMESEFCKHCRDNNLEGVHECLSLGVDVNTNTLGGAEFTGLMVACIYNNPAIVSRLVQVPGLKINYQDENGWTAALLACRAGRTQCVRILADTERVDWNKRNKWGHTPLHSALYNGHSDIVDIIVQQPNIDFNVQAEDGATLAQVAVKAAGRGGDVRCVDVETLAAQERCDCWNLPDKYGKLPTCWVLDGDTPIMYAVKQGAKYSKIVEILLRCPRVDLNCRDGQGWSLVFRAIQRNELGEKIF